MDQPSKKEKKARKKARAKRGARIKHWMEVSRTVCSLLALSISAATFIHVFKV